METILESKQQQNCINFSPLIPQILPILKIIIGVTIYPPKSTRLTPNVFLFEIRYVARIGSFTKLANKFVMVCFN